MSISPLLKLPAELRNAIYEDIAGDVNKVFVEIYGEVYVTGPCWTTWPKEPIHPLVQVCRQVRHEFLSVCSGAALTPRTIHAKVDGFHFDPLLDFLKAHPKLRQGEHDHQDPCQLHITLDLGCRMTMDEDDKARIVAWLQQCTITDPFDVEQDAKRAIIYGKLYGIAFMADADWRHHPEDRCKTLLKRLPMPLGYPEASEDSACLFTNLYDSIEHAHESAIKKAAMRVPEGWTRQAAIKVRMDELDARCKDRKRRVYQRAKTAELRRHSILMAARIASTMRGDRIRQQLDCKIETKARAVESTGAEEESITTAEEPQPKLQSGGRSLKARMKSLEYGRKKEEMFARGLLSRDGSSPSRVYVAQSWAGTSLWSVEQVPSTIIARDEHKSSMEEESELVDLEKRARKAEGKRLEGQMETLTL